MPPSYEAKVPQLQPHVAKGTAWAQYELGVAFDLGRGIEPHPHRAAELFTLAAAQGFAMAQNDLGDMYRFGHGVERNLQMAVELTTQAALQGYAYAQIKLATMYAREEEIRDNAAMVMWVKGSADQGETEAQVALSGLYLPGLGGLVEKSWWKAMEVCLLAVAQGDTRAMDLMVHIKKDGSRGQQVQLEGLVSAAQHNGKCGVVKQWVESKDRFQVVLDDGSVLLVRLQNMTQSKPL